MIHSLSHHQPERLNRMRDIYCARSLYKHHIRTNLQVAIVVVAVLAESSQLANINTSSCCMKLCFTEHICATKRFDSRAWPRYFNK